MSPHRAQRLKVLFSRLLLAALVVTAAAGVLWYRRIAGEPAPQAPPSELPGNRRAEMVTRDFRHVETRMDRTIWVLESKVAEIYDDEARLDRVKITWYGEPGELPVVVTSRSGRVNFRTRNAVLSGKVLLVRSDGARLATARLVWNEAERTLRAPFPVRVRTDGFSFRGSSLVADLERQSVRLNGPVSGDIPAGRVDRPRRS